MMSFIGRAMALGLGLGLAGSAAYGHDMWVNAASAHDAEDGSTTVVTSMGWGHQPLPVAEFIGGDVLDSYAVVAPDGSMLPLPFDATANADVNMVPEGDAPAGLSSLQGGDTFTRRIVFDADAAAGGWRAHAGLPARVYSSWTDADGATVSGPRFADELEDGAEIVSSAVTVRSSDSYWTIGAWSPPAPADVPLQLIPASDPMQAAAGDELIYELYRNGARVTPPDDAEFGAFSAEGEAGGEIDADGNLRVTLPEPGLWIVRSSHREGVAEAGAEYADLEGRIDAITFTATSAVHVRP